MTPLIYADFGVGTSVAFPLDYKEMMSDMDNYMISADESATLAARGETDRPRGICCCGAVGPAEEGHSSDAETVPACCDSTAGQWDTAGYTSEETRRWPCGCEMLCIDGSIVALDECAAHRPPRGDLPPPQTTEERLAWLAARTEVLPEGVEPSRAIRITEEVES